jgi:hypothetical protein
VTSRNHAATKASGGLPGWALLLLVLFAAGGCFRVIASDSPSDQTLALRQLPIPPNETPATGLGQDDPRLGMDGVADAAAADARN